MKNYLILGLATAGMLGASTWVSAQNNAPATMPNMMPNTMSVTTVEQVGNMEDETNVTLQGTLSQNLGDDMYVFTDATGNINVEIDGDDWNGNSFSPNMIVMISGEVDKNGNLTEIDVEEVQLAQ